MRSCSITLLSAVALALPAPGGLATAFAAPARRRAAESGPRRARDPLAAARRWLRFKRALRYGLRPQTKRRVAEAFGLGSAAVVGGFSGMVGAMMLAPPSPAGLVLAGSVAVLTGAGAVKLARDLDRDVTPDPRRRELLDLHGDAKRSLTAGTSELARLAGVSRSASGLRTRHRRHLKLLVEDAHRARSELAGWPQRSGVPSRRQVEQLRAQLSQLERSADSLLEEQR